MNRVAAAFLIACSCLAFGQGIDGLWMGNLETAGNSTPVLFMFSRSSDNAVSGRVFSAARNVSHELRSISIRDAALRWEVPRLDARFEGALVADGTSIEGIWTERARQQRLRLVRYNQNSFSLTIGADIDAIVTKPPTAVRADGRFHLMYELHVTNWDASEATIERLEIVIGDHVARLEGEALAMLFSSKSPRLGPGVRAAVILMFSSSSLPATLQHRLLVKRADQPAPVTVECAKVTVLNDAIRLSPPVRGKDWVMNEGPNVPSHHRMALMALNGRLTSPQRFAFDLHKARDAGEAANAPAGENSDHASYGEEVLAVADATVVAAVDGIPEGTPDGLTSPVVMDAKTINGNHIVLDLGAGRYALYAHLQPGLRVRAGERVLRGKVLGKIGNSGRSNSPHLHFHVADGPTLDAEGIPFVFDAFERDGVNHADEMPLHGWRVSFPQ